MAVRGQKTMDQRMTEAERFLASHGKTLEGHDQRLILQNEALVSHAQRITAIEAARQARKEEEIRREEQQKARDATIDAKLAAIEDKQDESKDTIKWLFRTVVAAVIGAVLVFIFKGGLVN